MRYISYFPMHYQDGNHNEGLGSFNLPGSSYRYRDEGVSNRPVQWCDNRDYDKNMMKWIMQKHESTFRYQVQELHRLYGRQRELMEEMKLRQSFLRTRTSQLSSQALFGLNHSVLSQPSWLLTQHYPHSRVLEQTTRNALQSHFFPASPCNRNMLDLELPVILQHDQKGKHVVHATDLNSNGRTSDFPIDLNQPIQIESPVSSSVSPMEALLHEQNSDDSNLMDFDLNSLPKSSSFSGTETTPVAKSGEMLSGTIFEFDLNSTVSVNEPSPEPSNSVASTSEAELMYPISPENQEASPPRCESEDIGHESSLSAIDLDTLTARTLVMIYSGEPGNADNCLSWFAEIVSSAEDDLKSEHEKEQGTMKVLEHKASAMKESVSMAISSNLTCSILQCKSWGKTGKREGACRRRRTV